MNIIDILVKHKLAISKGEARKLVCNGSISIDNEPITDVNWGN